MALNSVDIFTEHYYPISLGLLDEDATVAKNRQKVFIIGEYDWTGTQGPWTIICNQCAGDSMTPWTDTSKPSGPVWYMVRAYNMSAMAGAYSPVFAT